MRGYVHVYIRISICAVKNLDKAELEAEMGHPARVTLPIRR